MVSMMKACMAVLQFTLSYWHLHSLTMVGLEQHNGFNAFDCFIAAFPPTAGHDMTKVMRQESTCCTELACIAAAGHAWHEWLR